MGSSERGETSGDGNVDRMRKRITMEMDRTNTFTLSVDHENPQVAKDLAAVSALLRRAETRPAKRPSREPRNSRIQLEKPGKSRVQEEKLKRYKSSS